MIKCIPCSAFGELRRHKNRPVIKCPACTSILFRWVAGKE